MNDPSVVVATYRRPEQLAACLDGLQAQTQQPAEVLVIVQDADAVSGQAVVDRARRWPAVRLVRTRSRGSVAAYNAGLAAARGAIVAYVDDDAVPQPDWLERIVASFSEDPSIAAVGGRDLVVQDGRILTVRRRLSGRASSPPVGRIQWFGRMIANHHLGTGAARDVDVLKGVNMSFRRDAVIRHGFDERLRGHGATVHSELSICLPLRRRGLRIVYDPMITVVHRPAPRPAGDHRSDFKPQAVADAVHNEALQVLDYLRPGGRAAFALWSVAVGSTEGPGLLATIRDVLRGRPAPLSRMVAAQRGRATAWRAHLRTDRRAPRSATVVPDEN